MTCMYINDLRIKVLVPVALGRIACTKCIDAAHTYRYIRGVVCPLSVCLYVCLSVGQARAPRALSKNGKLDRDVVRSDYS